MLKEERLIVGNEKERATGILTCESCKRPIHSGRMCAACKNEVITAFQQSVSGVRKPSQNDYSTQGSKGRDTQEEENFKGVAKLQLKG